VELYFHCHICLHGLIPGTWMFFVTVSDDVDAAMEILLDAANGRQVL
jgi:hypothetical protein